MKKALILTGDAGFGHRAAANAVAEVLQNDPDGGFETKIVNLMDDPKTPKWLKNTQTDFDLHVLEMPKVYELAYDQSDKTVPTTVAHAGLGAILYNGFSRVMEEFQPDIIISTYPLFSGPISSWYVHHENLKRTKEGDQYSGKKPRKKHVPYIQIITDLYSVHSIWFTPAADRICVSTEKVRGDAIAFGCQPSRVVVTGIPVRQDVSEIQITKTKLRALYGLDPKLPLILAVGSKRVTSMMEYLNTVNHSGFNVQVVMAAGGDTELYERMKATEWHIPVKIYNYCDCLSELMLTSDMVLSKAGGLITSESLAAGLPMLLCDVLPGQEEGNVKIVEENGAGKLLRSQYDLLETLCHMLMNDGEKLHKMQANAAAIGKPRAAMDICKIADDLIREANINAGLLP